MRIPQTPPTRDKWFEAIKDFEPKNALAVADYMQPTDKHGRYLHWDELRRKPTPPGMTVEQVWGWTKLARLGLRQPLVFRDTNGQSFHFCEPPILRRYLHEIDSALRGGVGLSGKVPNATDGQHYLARSLIEEPFSSSVLEGAATTRVIARKLVSEDREPRTKDERMVLNNYRALAYVRSHIADPLTPEFILATHEIVTKGTLDNHEHEGRYRTAKDQVDVVDSTNQILHRPPHATEINERVERLCAFANQSEGDSVFLHPVLRAMLIHFQLAYIHPFADGNGRTARALFYWYALKSGYWLMEYISISSAINEVPVKYGRAFLNTETDDGDTTYFLIHQLKILTKAIQNLDAYLERQKARFENFETLMDGRYKELGLNQRQLGVLSDFIRRTRTSITIIEHQKNHKVSYLTARSDLLRLAEAGFLTTRKTGRTNIFLANQDKLEELLDAV